MKAALRDCSFYERPSGFGNNPRPAKYHAIVDRPDNKWGADLGPACGYPFYQEWSETPAERISANNRCNRPGCRAAFTKFDKERGETDGK